MKACTVGLSGWVPSEWRKLRDTNANVVAEVTTAWCQIKDIAICAAIEVSEAIADAALQRFSTQALDGYDLLMLDAIERADIGQIKVITDDRDYAVVPDIQLYQ